MIVVVFGGSYSHESRVRALLDGVATVRLGQSAPAPRAEDAAELESQVRGARSPRAIVFEADDDPSSALRALPLLRGDEDFRGVPVFLSVRIERLAEVSPEHGFDDFLLQPYAPEELWSRVRTLEWRRANLPHEERGGDIVLNRAGREVRVDGRPVRLTSREFALFSYLWLQRGRVLSRRQLLNAVWGEEYSGGPRTVDIHVRRLRFKFGPAMPLATCRGVGYVLNVRLAADPLPRAS